MGATRKSLISRLPWTASSSSGSAASPSDAPGSSGFVVSDVEARLLGTAGSEARWGHERRSWLEKSRRRLRPGARGWMAPHAGRVARIEPSVEMRATTKQACGYWPFTAGAPLPTIGVPLGRHLMSGATVCADPMSYFLAGLVNQPSMFVLGRPGLGKSTLVRRTLTVLAAWGFTPMVLGDLKPDYVDLIEAMDGVVIRIGRGMDRINPLDWGPLWDQIQELPEKKRRVAREELRGRRLSLVTGLAAQGANRELRAVEKNILARALRITDETTDARDGRMATISDLLAAIDSAPEELRRIAQTGADEDKYTGRVQELVDALRMFEAGGPFGDLFDGQTTAPIRLDVPLCFDLSTLESDEAGGTGLEAAVQLVCWSAGSSAVSAAKHLAQAGLAEQRHYFLVMDELWRILRAGPFMIEFIDALTRLNRQRGLGQAMATHTMADLDMGDEKLTKRAWGFVERSALVYLGGLATGEMGNLQTVFELSQKETSLITDWASDAEVDPDTEKSAAPPGRGKFLLKIGKRPGTPFAVDLTEVERDVNDTNRAWADVTARLEEQAASLQWTPAEESQKLPVTAA